MNLHIKLYLIKYKLNITGNVYIIIKSFCFIWIHNLLHQMYYSNLSSHKPTSPPVSTTYSAMCKDSGRILAITEWTYTTNDKVTLDNLLKQVCDKPRSFILKPLVNLSQ